MAASGSNQKNRFIVFILATAVVALALYLLLHFELELRAYLGARLTSHAVQDSLVRIPQLILWSVLAFLGVRALSGVTFDFVFRTRRGYEAPALVRNIFSMVAFTILFVLIFQHIYSEVNLGVLFTTSAIFGVIIALAFHDNMGNFLAGISLEVYLHFQGVPV